MDESVAKGGPVKHLGYAAVIPPGLFVAALQSGAQDDSISDPAAVWNLDATGANSDQCAEHRGGCFVDRKRHGKGAESEDDQGGFGVAGNGRGDISPE